MPSLARKAGAMWISIAAFVFSCISVGGAIPTNDNFENRIAMVGSPVTVMANNEAVTREENEPTLGERTVWWSWTPTNSGAYTLTATSLSYFYPFIGVYEGSVLTNLSADAIQAFNGLDDSYAARVVINAKAGTNYDVAVSTVAGAGGDLKLNIIGTEPPLVTITSPTNNAVFYAGTDVFFQISASDPDGTITNVELDLDSTVVKSFISQPYEFTVSFKDAGFEYAARARATDNSGVTTISDRILFRIVPPPPANDDFAKRISITGAQLSVSGVNIGATKEASDPTEGIASVWWRWTAPATGPYTISVTGTNFTPFLGLYSGSALGNLTAVATEAGTAVVDSSATVEISAVAGESYAIGVASVDGTTGALTLNIVETKRPTVKVTNPTNNATVFVGTNVTFAAVPSDADGTIDAVEFYL